MQTVAVARSGFRTMRRYKLRSFFMMLGVLVGIAGLTLSVSIGKAAERKITTSIDKFFSASSVLVSAGGGRLTGGPHAQAARLTLEDIEALAHELPNIETWDPMQMIAGREVRYQGQSATIRVFAYSERSERVWNRGASRGRYFDAEAVARSERVALVGEAAAAELFGDDDPIGGSILIGSVPFRVIGVLESIGTDPHGMDRDRELVVPISTAMRRLMNADTIMAAKLLVRDPARMEQTAQGIRRILRERHAIAPGRPDDFRVITPVEVKAMVANASRVFSVLLPLIAGVSLLVGGAVTASLMLVSVTARVKEIGIRRAVGARPRDIRLQFLLETALVTMVGGVAGIVLGLAGVLVLVEKLGMPRIFPWQAIALGVAATVLIGFAAGILPARRAARWEPVDALR